MAAHSLLLSLRDHSGKFSEIVVHDAPDFFPTCTLNSTAIVASRGVSSGLSDLGDLLMAGYQSFSTHVESERPDGIQKITQYTGTNTKEDQFLKRYPQSVTSQNAGNISLKSKFLLAQEDAYQITPALYLKWIRETVSKKLPVTFRKELFLNDEMDEKKVFCGGVANYVWDKNLKSQPAQGSYLEFSDVSFEGGSFSLTLEGQNLIYHHKHKTLLISSTTETVQHYLAPVSELREIYDFLKQHVDLKLPEFSSGVIKTGLREKAPKRMPYISESMIGGFYKNGFSLSLEMSRRWCETYL